MQQKTRFLSYGVLALAAVIFVALNLMGNTLLNRFRLDLTEHKLYTLSDGTRNVIDGLKEPMKLRFFFSEEAANGYPALQAYGNRVKGMLKAYTEQSGGKLQLEIINPEPFTEAEDRAVALGVQAIPLDETGTKLYFGLIATNSVDEIGSIPFFDPERAPWLEYDITRIIYDLSQPKKPVVGIMSWLPIFGGASSPTDIQGRWVILDQINQNFKTKHIGTDVKEIPADVDVLMVVHPAKASADTLYAIDQFMLRGGRALIFTDPYTNIKGLTHSESEVNQLYNAWGIDMPPVEMVLDKTVAIRMSDDERGSSLRTVSNPAWLALTPDNFDKDDLITSTLQLVRMAAAGHFVYLDDAKKTDGKKPGKAKRNVTMTPLISTGKEAMVGKSYALMVNQDPTELLNEYKPGGKELVLAARVQGQVKSAFPERKGRKHLSESKGEINAILVADSDMLQDGFWVNAQAFYGQRLLVPTAHNGFFVLNALDHLTGSGDLIGLRSRSDYDRPFQVVEQIRQDAEVKFRNREQELRVKLKDLEQKLNDMQSTGRHEASGKLVVSDEQQRELLGYRDEILATRKELRSVQRSLIEDIDALGNELKLVNIGLVPLLVIILAFILPRRLGVKRS